MRQTTIAWLKIESIGAPHLTKTMSGGPKDIVLEIMKFMMANSINRRFVFTVASNEANLDVGKAKSITESDMEAELERLMMEAADGHE